MSVKLVSSQEQWQTACNIDDLVTNSGICTLVAGQQIAIFYLPSQTPAVYAVGNWDPIGEANVISRGIVGSIGEALVVASPLYKQHFSLTTGECLEQPEHTLPAYAVRLQDDTVEICVN